MQFEYTPPQTPYEEMMGGHRCINAFGRVELGDDEKFSDFLRKSQVPYRTDLYIDSVGGSVEAAIEIGRQIRENWFSTHVGQYILDVENQPENRDIYSKRRFLTGKCMSAATLMYLGGRLRFLRENDRFGVHQFSFRDPTPSHIGRSQILSSRIARYISDMGIPAEFLEISASVDSDVVKDIDHSELRKLRVVTDGQTPVEWTVQSRNDTLYVRGERDSIFGHHKLCLGFAKPQFYLHAVIESQGRAEQLTQFALVELVIGPNDRSVIDLSERALRFDAGFYTNVFSMLSPAEALGWLSQKLSA
ncbi:hypothetical protein [Mesorhizobium sp. 128a]